MNNFKHFLTPQQASRLIKVDGNYKSIKLWNARANDNRTCFVCDEKVWKLVNTDLCFTCTTGESDASDDYELI